MPDETPESPFAELEKLVADEAEGRSAPKRQTARSATDRGVKQAPFEKRLYQFFTMVALVVSAILDPYCGGIVQARAQVLAKAWNDLATQDKNVRQALEWLLSGGNYGTAILMTALTIIPILKHHGMLPENLLPENILSIFGGNGQAPSGGQPNPPYTSAPSGGVMTEEEMETLADAGS